MLPQGRVEQLLEEILDSGRTPEEVCADATELLQEVRERWGHLRNIQLKLQALFPQSDKPPGDGVTQPHLGVASLTRIPGYDVTEVLGSGGMGIVYKGIHRKLNRTVALKMLLSSRSPTASARQAVAALSREAQAIAAMRHANIVQVHDAGEADGCPYFTMEYMEGGTLAKKLAGVPMSVADAASMIATLARAVEAAHQRGIVHRDLKPSNVLLTADGTPKISDFGLAIRTVGLPARLDSEPTEARVGTPSYMAPEQASGIGCAVGPLADVYALGAILYEMLTGRPPFRGESPAETVRQLLSQDLVMPSRLNSRTPRDLETICLKCLQKDPLRRYETAGELADDVRRFQHNEPIRARPVSLLERAIKLVRRHKAATLALATAVMLLAFVLGIATWVAATNRAADQDLHEAVQLQRLSQWSAADRVIDRASVRIAAVASSDLHRRLEQARRDSKLVARLDVIRSTREAMKYQGADSDYSDAFRTALLGGPADPPDVVAARVRDSNVKSALIDALDDWSSFSEKHRPWLLAVARIADHDPTGWRDHVRDPAVCQNREALVKAATTAPFADQPVSFLLLTANLLNSLGEKPVPMLIRVQEAHPDDFWINLHLGDLMAQGSNPAEAIRYLQAAEAIRPNAEIARNNLAFALQAANRWDEAIPQLRAAVRLDPGSFMARENLAVVLSRTGHEAEAVSQLEDVIRGDPANPNRAFFYACLGHSLAQLGRDEEAVSALRMSINIGPSHGGAFEELRGVLMRQGHWDEIEAVWQTAIKTNPTSHDSWDGYAEYCIFVGHVKEYKTVCRQLLDRFGDAEDPSICERTGRACLLLGDGNQETVRAAAAVDRALLRKAPQAAAYHRYYMVAKGLADYRLGDLNLALSDVGGDAASVLKPLPQLVAAMAHYRLGHAQAARTLLAESALAFDWSRDKATTHEAWINQVLRREAEQLILPNLKSLIDGSAKPDNNDERIALLGICEFEDLRGRCAQLWVEILGSTSQSSDDQIEMAARATALAGSGQGKDAANFAGEDRARWRATAIGLLTKRIDGLERQLKSAPLQKAAIQKLLALQQGRELAGLREPNALASLPEGERARCAALWSRLRAVLDRYNQGA